MVNSSYNIYSNGDGTSTTNQTISSSPQTIELLSSCKRCFEIDNVDGEITFTVDFSGNNIILSYQIKAPEPKTYTIYFYDKENKQDLNLKAHYWDDSHNADVALTSTGKYVTDGTNYWPAWQATFTSTWKPTGIIIFNGETITDNNKLTPDATFEDNGFYTNKEDQPTQQTLVDKEQRNYTVYFFDANDSGISNVKAYVWQDKNNSVAPWDGEAMTSTGKHVYYRGKYCPVWKYTFTWKQTPKGICFTGNGMSQTRDFTFIDGAYYDIANSHIGMALVDKPTEESVTLYMHWEEDFVKKGDYSTGGKPRCHVFKSGTGIQYKNFGTDAEKMYLVSEKYQIWGFDVPKSEIDQYDAITFYYYDNKKQLVDKYESKAGDGHEPENWTKYIYSVNKGSKAIQTYLSYDQFQELDAMGRPHMYILGGGMDGTDAAISIEINNETKTLGWDPAKAQVVDPDDGCFYLKLTPEFKDQEQVGFKFGWISVADSRKNAKSDMHCNSLRDWATFDLGAVGVDDITIQNKGWNSILKIENPPTHDPGWAIFSVNKSMPYLNYNQYNWVIKKSNVTVGIPYYVVVDTHNECRSVTLASFDPHPTVAVNVAEVEKETVSYETAKLIRETPLLASCNGPIYMTDLNKASGSATIKKADGSIVGEAGFSVEYALNLNGRTITASNPGTIHLDYIPVAASDREISVRAKYTDNYTGLTFHSRTGTGTITLPKISLEAPKELKIKGRYIYQGINETTGKQIYGVYTDGLDCEIIPDNSTTPLNVYSDFSFDNGTGWFVHDGLDWYDTYGKLVEDVNKWQYWVPDDNHEGNINWSKSLMKDREPAPLFIGNVEEVDSFDELKAIKEEKTYTGKVYGVYPFLYNPEAELEVKSNVPAANTQNDAATQSYEGYVVTNTYIPADIKVFVTTDNAVSGIESVEAETAADAPVEYYTISGIRVNGTPEPGIYIRRQGEKVAKVAVK